MTPISTPNSTHSTHLLFPLHAGAHGRHTGIACYAYCRRSDRPRNRCNRRETEHPDFFLGRESLDLRSKPVSLSRDFFPYQEAISR
jgi:hypothetical protein